MTMQLLTALIIFLSAPVMGVNLLFFGDDGLCDTTNEDFLVFSDLPQHKCCQSPLKDFCGASILQHLNGSITHYVMAEGLCDKNGTYDSNQDYNGLSYCMPIPKDDASDRCSSYWESITDRDVVLGGGDREMDCQEPDKMVYHDGTAMRQIHLPDGTFWNAMKHYEAKNYKELAAFPEWNGSNADADG